MVPTGVVIRPVPDRISAGPAFDESGMPTIHHVEESPDGVISKTHLDMCNARMNKDVLGIIDIMVKTYVYIDYVEEHCSLQNMKIGKLSILDAILDDGFRSLESPTPGQRQA